MAWTLSIYVYDTNWLASWKGVPVNYLLLVHNQSFAFDAGVLHYLACPWVVLQLISLVGFSPSLLNFLSLIFLLCSLITSWIIANTQVSPVQLKSILSPSLLLLCSLFTCSLYHLGFTSSAFILAGLLLLSSSLLHLLSWLLLVRRRIPIQSPDHQSRFSVQILDSGPWTQVSVSAYSPFYTIMLWRPTARSCFLGALFRMSLRYVKPIKLSNMVKILDSETSDTSKPTEPRETSATKSSKKRSDSSQSLHLIKLWLIYDFGGNLPSIVLNKASLLLIKGQCLTLLVSPPIPFIWGNLLMGRITWTLIGEDL